MLKRLRFRDFIVISFALHGLFVLLMNLSKMRPENKVVTIEILDQKPAPLKTVPPPQKLKKVQDKALEKQIVEQDEKKTNEPAPDTRFLSAQNQKVQKQTVAKNKGEFKNSKNKVGSPSKTVSQKSWSLAPKLNTAEIVANEGMKKAEKTGGPEQKKDQTEMTDVSQSSDYIKDVDEGLETLLNAKEFKYYTYYNRIRRQLSEHWEPKVRTKLSQMFKQGRYIASATDRVTKLIVVLDRAGNLVKVQVLKESGVTDLDDAATEAFQSAAPFPNPPAGIVEPDGTVKIRWDFVLET